MRKFPRYWRPLVKADLSTFGPEPEAVVAKTAEQYGISIEAARKKLRDEFEKCEYWVNNLYQVEVRKMGEKWVQLNIRHRNGTPLFRDWRHFQEIKNQLVGLECEGIEIYPAESRLVDTSNKFHIWCCTDPSFRFPMGFDFRDVDYDDTSKTPGLRQRAF